ncbi:MAG: hypothetical protein ACC645_17505, partial [Pirellulales bacterium]
PSCNKKTLMMDFQSINDVRGICRKIANGTAVDIEEIASGISAIRIPLSKEEQDKLPPGFLQVLRLVVHRDEVMRDQLIPAIATIKVLASAVEYLAGVVEGMSEPPTCEG